MIWLFTSIEIVLYIAFSNFRAKGWVISFLSCKMTEKPLWLLKKHFCILMSHFSFKVSGNTKMTAMVVLNGTGNIKITLLNCLELLSDRSISTLKLNPLLAFWDWSEVLQRTHWFFRILRFFPAALKAYFWFYPCFVKFCMLLLPK